MNNILTNLSKALKVAVEWKVIPSMPCWVRLLKAGKAVVEFYEPEEYRRLVEAAGRHDPRARIVVLLGGDAGLRLGEIEGLEWTDVDFGRALLKVQRAVYRSQVTLPKGGQAARGATDREASRRASGAPSPEGYARALRG